MHVADRIRQVQDYLGMRLALENVSYYTAPGSRMSELEFLLSVLDRSRTKHRPAIERKEDDLFTDDGADIVMQTDNFAAGDCLDQRHRQFDHHQHTNPMDRRVD